MKISARHPLAAARRSLFTATLLALPACAMAANNTWNGAGGAIWDVGTTVSWTGPTTWTNADTAIFGTTGAGPITVGAGVTAAGLTINAGATGYVFSGASLTSTGNVGLNESAQFNNNVSFGTNLSVAAGKTLTLTGGGNLASTAGGSASAGTINFTAGAYSFAASSFFGNSGAGGLNMNFTGSSTFSSGGNNVIGYTNPVALTYNSSGTSTLAGTNLGRAGTGTSSITVQQGVINATNTVTVSGGANATLDVQGGTFNSGTQAITINNNNTAFAGLVKVQGGTLTAGTVALNSGIGGSSTFQLSSGTANINNFTQANAGTKSITLSGGTIGTNTVTAATWTPDINLTGNVNIRTENTVGASANLTLSGQLTGAGGLTKTGAGALIISGATTTYGGGTVLSVGTLTTLATGSLGSGNVTITGSGVLTLGNSQSIGDIATLMFTDTSAVQLGFTGTETVGAVINSSTSTGIAPGTYTAAQLNSKFGGISIFSGNGSLTIIPEPGSATLIALSALTLFRRRR